MPSRRFNSESSELSVEKNRNDRDSEDWDVHDRYKSNADRNYGKHGAPYFGVEVNRRFYERNDRRLISLARFWEIKNLFRFLQIKFVIGRFRDLDGDRNSEENWDRDSNRENRDSVSREKERDRHLDERNKSDISYEEDKEWRRNKERKSEDRDIIEMDDEREKDLGRKDERREDRRIERPQRPDSRDSRASRESRNSRDSIREEK